MASVNHITLHAFGEKLGTFIIKAFVDQRGQYRNVLHREILCKFKPFGKKEQADCTISGSFHSFEKKTS